MRLVEYQQPGLFNHVSRLQNELDRLFGATLQTWTPRLEVLEDKDNYTVRVEAPGLKREDLQVSMNENSLVIEGERKAETPAEGVTVQHTERLYGKFERVIELPAAVAADKVKADYKDGVLAIILPKAEEAKPRQIAINVN
jgi:HSP20 family protein